MVSKSFQFSRTRVVAGMVADQKSGLSEFSLVVPRKERSFFASSMTPCVRFVSFHEKEAPKDGSAVMGIDVV
jgi:hypothetical protein